jgi:hypothetical protein
LGGESRRAPCFAAASRARCPMVARSGNTTFARFTTTSRRSCAVLNVVCPSSVGPSRGFRVITVTGAMRMTTLSIGTTLRPHRKGCMAERRDMSASNKSSKTINRPSRRLRLNLTPPVPSLRTSSERPDSAARSIREHSQELRNELR